MNGNIARDRQIDLLLNDIDSSKCRVLRLKEMDMNGLNDWIITHEPPPIPLRTCDWRYVHKDYDGAPDAHDSRYGYAATYEEAVAEIIELGDSQ